MSFSCCGGLSLGDTGLPNSVKVFDRGHRHWLVPLFKKDGTRNQILDTDTLDKAYFEALIEAPDREDRWYPLAPMADVTAERADPTTQTFNSGNSAVTQQGVRTYDLYAQKTPASYMKHLEKWVCNRKFGLIVIDKCGRPGGVLCPGAGSDGQDAIRPMPIFAPSWNPQLVMATQDNVGGVRIRFEFEQSMQDSTLRIVEVANAATEDYLRYDADGLIPTRATNVSATATEATATLRVDSDGSFEPPVVAGWVLQDFNIQNLTTNTSVTPSAVAEAPEGTYQITYPSQTSGDTLRISGIKAGIVVRFNVTIA